MKFTDRTGEINISNERYKMKIIKYNEYNDVLVEFQDEHRANIHTSYKHFKKGQVKNPYHPSVFGIGYLGEGKYKTRINNKITKEYNVWYDMIERCYEPYTINKNLTYKDVFVCDEWHNFQNFGKWWEENVYNCNNERMHLDKDILVKENKIYSPETCIIVPQRINNLFVKCDKVRGEYPIGVCLDKERNLFISFCNILENNKKKNKYLGRYNNELDAFLAYKQFKEKYIKEVADEYKDLIPIKLYNAMYEWKIEIND